MCISFVDKIMQMLDLTFSVLNYLNAIDARRVVLTRVRETFVDVVLAVDAREAGVCTVARVSVSTHSHCQAVSHSHRTPSYIVMPH